MILEADRNGCAREVLIITAALSIQDVRERPADHQDAADAQHARFADPTSDFLTYLNLWKYLKEQQNARSSNQFRKMCRTEFLNYLRVREWQDLEAQLRQLVKPLGVTINRGEPAEPDAIHQALLAGLLSHIGLKTEAINEYQGARNARFAVFPGSALFKKPPKWVMSAELVETSKLWARINARILPEWVEPLAQHLVKRTYSEPHWEQKAGAVIGYEKVLLYGIPIVASRKVNYGRIDPELSRDLFIRHALVEGEWVTNHRFFHENRELLDDAEDLEHKARRRDIVVVDETLFEFYDQRIPADVVSGRHFDSWWKRARRDTPDLLTFTPDLLIRDSADGVSADDYPDTWDGFRLTYQFEPGTDADGVTAHIPLDVLNQVDPDGFTWQVPGLRQELVTALIKSLPKPLRRSFVPAPDTARQALAALDEPHGRLTDALGAVLNRLRGVTIPDDAWNWAQVPDHLEITFRVVDDGKVVAEGKDLDALRDELQPKLQQVISSAASSIERNGLTTWDLDTLPTTFQTERGGRVITGYPALVDQGSTVAVRVLKTEAEQESATWAGVRRLLLLSVPSPTAFVQRHLSNRGKLILSSHGPVGDLLEDCAAAAVDALIAEAGGPPRDQAGFDALRESVRAELIDSVFAIVADVEKILEAAADVRSRLGTTSSLALAPSLLDARTHLESLIAPGFVTATGQDRLRDLLRYVRAIGRRLDKLPASPQRDRTHQATVERMTEEWEAAGKPDDARWMIEELRVSLFGQELGTKFPISEKRILRALDTHAP